MKINLMSINFEVATLKQLTKHLDSTIYNQQQLKQVITVNSSMLVYSKKNQRLSEIINTPENITVCDGQPVVWSSHALNKRLPERIGGIDLMSNLLNLANEKDYRIYFLGSSDSTLVKMIKNLKTKHKSLNIVGYQNGYYSEDEKEEVLRKIINAKPNILFVGMGSPKQEFLIDDLKKITNNQIQVALGVGGSFEIFAGNLKRAPIWIQKSGLEWFYRMLQEPKRLVKRYLITNSLFILLFIKEYIIYSVKRLTHWKETK